MEGVAGKSRQSRKHPVERLLGYNAAFCADLDGIFACPSYETQASPGAETKGSPSQTPYLRETDTSASTQTISRRRVAAPSPNLASLYTKTPEFKRWFGDSKDRQ